MNSKLRKSLLLRAEGTKMGKLRTEPKYKTPALSENYDKFLEIIEKAKNVSESHNSYYDLDPGEKVSNVRKEMMAVAEKAGFIVKISRVRGSDSLVFSFKESAKPSSGRMSAEDSSARILQELKLANKAMQKHEIIQNTGISSSTWNIRIKQLLDSGQVTRTGDRRDTKYTLA